MHHEKARSIKSLGDNLPKDAPKAIFLRLFYGNLDFTPRYANPRHLSEVHLLVRPL